MGKQSMLCFQDLSGISQSPNGDPGDTPAQKAVRTDLSVAVTMKRLNMSWAMDMDGLPSDNTTGWWFGCHEFYFPIYWVANHPN